MKDSDPKTRKLPLRQFLKVVWESGDNWSRFFELILFVGYIAPIVPAVWLFSTFPPEIEHSFGIAWLSGLLYLPAVATPLFTAEVGREAVRRGWTSPDDEYYLALAEYLMAHGKNGRSAGDIAWGLSGWVLFYGMMTLGTTFAIVAFPLLGPLTVYAFAVVNIPVALSWFFIFHRRQRRLLREGQETEPRLAALFPKPDARR
jgi:hypothetical protein